jgi:hypothetical protein
LTDINSLPSHSQRLRQKIELVRPRLRAATGRAWNHPRLAELYPDLVFATHSIIRATNPSMRAAGECARARAAGDPVARALAEYLTHHAEEEKGHDEWALDDLAVLGVSRDEVWRRIPSPAVAELVGSQYYWLYHFHPVAYVSYIAVLEAPPSIDFLEDTVRRTGLPREAFATQFYHSKLDHHHVREFNQMVDSLPLDEWHHSILGVSAFHTAELLSRVFDDVVERFEVDHPAFVSAP